MIRMGLEPMTRFVDNILTSVNEIIKIYNII